MKTKRYGLAEFARFNGSYYSEVCCDEVFGCRTCANSIGCSDTEMNCVLACCCLPFALTWLLVCCCPVLSTSIFCECVPGRRLAVDSSLRANEDPFLQYEEERLNGEEIEEGPKLPKDGECMSLRGETRKGYVYGTERRGQYFYKVRYDEGPEDRAFMEKNDIVYLTQLLEDGTLHEKEPEVWYLREIDNAQERDIGDWWSEKLAEDLNYWEEIKATKDPLTWHLEKGHLERRLENAEEDYEQFVKGKLVVEEKAKQKRLLKEKKKQKHQRGQKRKGEGKAKAKETDQNQANLNSVSLTTISTTSTTSITARDENSAAAMISPQSPAIFKSTEYLEKEDTKKAKRKKLKKSEAAEFWEDAKYQRDYTVYGDLNRIRGDQKHKKDIEEINTEQSNLLDMSNNRF